MLRTRPSESNHGIPASLRVAEEGTLLLDLPDEAFAHLPAEIVVAGEQFARKADFHITAFRGERFIERLRASNASPEGLSHLDIERAVRAAATSLAEQHFVVRLHPDIWRLEKWPDASIMQLCAVDGMDALTAAVTERLEEYLVFAELPQPPTHVTLYTRGKERGIGVPSVVELAAYGTQLSGSALADFLDATSR